ncbi:M13 family metallopeptidase [Granulicella tundricola]|uniref:Endothelin-converting enzyme 1 n=1 Tax=Granulicella tundricola (strain ATCC BAA-1859 / DSM 23138 / MP5ACTX9) TaxID=1198114 RepID=E8X0H9_GRATM|nr:M13 family metallopeptidase [Granulicella tundricola]ADW67843.1 Endothelin-converting enzyme 1 [Granulicella tundricola MP5ACTX9]
MRIQSVASYLLLSGTLLAGGSALGQNVVSTDDNGPTSAPKKPMSFDLSSIDKTADPCTDFYQYACGNWIKNNPIPPTETRWGSFNTLGEQNQYLLWKELSAAAANPKTPLQTKYGNYYAACMDVKRVNELGVKPIQPELAQIAELTDKKKLAALDVALENTYGSGFLFGVAVGQDQKDSSKQILQTGQGGLTLPDREYYLSDDARNAKIREQYVDHVTKMFVLMGDTPEKAATEAADVMRIETALAKGSMSRTEMRDPAARYHITTIAQLQELSPDFDWHVFLTGVGVAQATTINVSSPGFVKTVNTLVDTESLEALKTYMRWHVLHGAAAYLSEPFVDENFNFFAKTLTGQKEQQPRYKRCTRLTDGALGEAVGQDWVKENFPPDAKANMEKLVAALRKALDQDIQQLPWMSPETKVEAEKKLVAFRQKIGYPETWRDYSKLTVKRDDFVGNLARNSVFERNRNLGRLGKPVDETEWGMTPPTVNAYYNPPQNDINFPAGILQPPFFDNTKDPAVNFGGIGVVIGHEMTHGFDDQGSKYGPTGNVKYNTDGTLGSWFTPEDQKKFDERTKCVADEYSGFNVAEGQNLNGRLTLGENSADNGGIRIAYQALQQVMAKQGISPTSQIDGYTPAQRFFISFGQVWCSNQTEQSARVLAKTDPHSPGKWRTDGTVQNFDEFGKAFSCKVGQPMMPEKSCRVW